MQPFNKRLQCLARRKNFDQSDLVRALRKDKGTISKWWRGEVTPGTKNMRAIQEYFQCDMDWLETGEGEPFPLSKLETAEKKGNFETRLACKEQDEKLTRMEMAIFKNQCPGFFDEFFEFIADEYGPTREGVAVFFEDYKNNKSHTHYRLWLGEKKRAKEGDKTVPGGSVNATGK